MVINFTKRSGGICSNKVSHQRQTEHDTVDKCNENETGKRKNKNKIKTTYNIYIQREYVFDNWENSFADRPAQQCQVSIGIAHMEQT